MIAISKSLLSGLDWSTPPVKCSPLPVKPEAGHSANVVRESGPLTEFLTTGIPLHVGDSAGLMHLGAVAELLQAISTEANAGPLEAKVAAGVPQDRITAGPQPVAGPSQRRPVGLFHLEPLPLQAAVEPQLGTLQPGATVVPPHPPHQGVVAEPLQLGASAGPVTTAGPPHLGSTAGPPQLGVAVGPLQLGSDIHQLQDPMVVMSLPEFETVDETNLGRFSQVLACRSVLGEDVLPQSTFKGDSRRGLKMLDKSQLSQLFTLINHRPSFLLRLISTHSSRKTSCLLFPNSAKKCGG